MKKTTTLFFFMLFSMLHSLSAQDMQEWKWDSYGIGFSIPSDFKVSDKSKSSFSADNHYIILNIRPWHDAHVKEENLADMALSEVMNMGYAEVTEFEKLELKGFVGYGTTGMKDDVFCSVGFLMDTGTDTNFIISVCYEEGWSDVAVDILSSVYNY